MYDEGVSLNEIGKQLKICSNKFSKWLKSQGVNVRYKSTGLSTAKKRVTFFENIDTEEKAYWLGFLYADGCVRETKRNDKLKAMILEVGLSSIDREHLEKFLFQIKYDGEVKYKDVKLGNKSFESCRVNVCDTEMCRDLVKLGCTPRKSLTLTFPTEEQVPKHLQIHFIRGYVDGDGSIGLRNVNYKGRECKRGLITILGTKDFLEKVVEVTGWKRNTIQKPSGTYQIEWNNKSTIEEYLDLIYKGANIYLERKYDKYLEIKQNCRLS